MKTNDSRSFIADLLPWVVALITLVLAARLALTLFNLIFDFWATPLGRLLSEGALFARLGDLSPFGIARQLAIILVIATVIVFAQRARHSGAEQPTADRGK